MHDASPARDLPGDAEARTHPAVTQTVPGDVADVPDLPDAATGLDAWVRLDPGLGGGTSGRDVTAPDGVTVVAAAGVVCWRWASVEGLDRDRGRARTDQSLQVLVVHRPRYDDWSLPKGKREPGEPLPVTAVRECAEETGVRPRLGRRVGVVGYPLPDGTFKRVTYWSAAAPGAAPLAPPRPEEVDRTLWVSVTRAAALLTHEHDVRVVDAVARAARAGALETVPVVVLRHASARPRDTWGRADRDRPLVGSGRRQAANLAALLECWGPERVLSSPWRRCADTVAPWAQRARVKVGTKGGLTETGFRKDDRKAAKHLTTLVEHGQPALLCTHRPVLAGVLGALRRFVVDGDVRRAVPHADPYLKPAEVLVAHVSWAGSSPVVVAVERHLPD